MADTYFFNAQNADIAINLNSGEHHVVPAMNKRGPVVPLPLAATQVADVFGTDSANHIDVTTTGKSDRIKWVVETTGILPDRDIQFMVFDNALLARQGATTTGFSIIRSTGRPRIH